MGTTKPPAKRSDSELAVATCAQNETPYMVCDGVMMLPDGTFVCEGMRINLRKGCVE